MSSTDQVLLILNLVFTALILLIAIFARWRP